MISKLHIASDYGGSTGGECIQSALDAAEDEHQSGIVVVGPNGPNKEDSWVLHRAIEIPSKTTLILCGATLRLAPDTNDNLLRNQAAENPSNDQDTEIHIVGIGNAYLDGNAANQNRQESIYRNYGIHLFQVNRCSISGLRVGPTNAWAIALEDVTDAFVTNLRFDQDGTTPNQDGIHLSGPGRNIAVANITGIVGDDAVAVDAAGSASDPRDPARGSGGNLSNVTINNISIRNVSAGAALRTIAATDAKLNGVTATNLHAVPDPDAEGSSPILKIGWDRGVPRSRGWENFDHLPTPEDHRNILITNVVGKTDTDFCAVESSVQDLTIRSVRGEHGSNAATFYGDKAQNIQFDDWITTSTENGNAITVKNRVCDDLQITDSKFYASTNKSDRAGLHLEGSDENKLVISNLLLQNTVFADFGTGITYSNVDFSKRLDLDNVRFKNTREKYDIQMPVVYNGLGIMKSTHDMSVWHPGDIVIEEVSEEDHGDGQSDLFIVAHDNSPIYFN